MIGTIKVADVLPMLSANGRHGETVEQMLNQARSNEGYAELRESIRRYGVDSPILIRYEELCNGEHRIAACIELGIKEIPFTDDPAIGWANEFSWPEEKEVQNCE